MAAAAAAAAAVAGEPSFPHHECDDDASDEDAFGDDAADILLTPAADHSTLIPADTSPFRRRRSLPSSGSTEEPSHQPVESTATSTVTADASDDATSADPPPTLLETLAGLVIHAVLFQFNAFLSFLMFPFLVLQYAYLAVSDPLGTTKRAVSFITRKISDCGKPVVQMLGEQGAGGVAFQIVLGLFWAMYVCAVLAVLLLMAFLGARVFARAVVKQPLQVAETLRFDYTRASPAAVVPIDWMMTPKQKLEATVSMTLPESDYNRRLGVFQVRAEFLNADGKVLASSSQPCMLRFKSSHMHFIGTLLRSIALLSGFSSESQVIKVKLKGFTARAEASKYVKISIEQRAEFQPGAGIPEIYEASLNVESDLPLVRRIIWNWRGPMFVCITMALFSFQLLFMLLCCRSLVVPRIRPGTGAT